MRRHLNMTPHVFHTLPDVGAVGVCYGTQAKRVAAPSKVSVGRPIQGVSSRIALGESRGISASFRFAIGIGMSYLVWPSVAKRVHLALGCDLTRRLRHVKIFSQHARASSVPTEGMLGGGPRNIYETRIYTHRTTRRYSHYRDPGCHSVSGLLPGEGCGEESSLP